MMSSTGDWPSCTRRAWFRVVSKTASPVLLTKSATMMLSFLAPGGAVWFGDAGAVALGAGPGLAPGWWRNRETPPANATSSKAPMTIMRERRERPLACGTIGAAEGAVEEAIAGRAPADGEADVETASRSASNSSALRYR